MKYISKYNESLTNGDIYSLVSVYQGEEKVLATFTEMIYAADYMIKWTNEYIHDDFPHLDEWTQDGDIPEKGYFEPFFDENGKSNFFHESSNFNLDENEDWDRCKEIQNIFLDVDCASIMIHKNKLYSSPFKGQFGKYSTHP
jgi:hypothetical protein